MKHAIQFLSTEMLVDIQCEPTLRADGDTGPADDCAARAAEFREAIGVLQRHEDRIGYNAGLLYDTYCKAVGGVAFNGDPLPDWDTFRADPGKQKQVEAWLAVGRTAAGDGGIIVNPAFSEMRPMPDSLNKAIDGSLFDLLEPTTIRGWLKTLPDGYKERALANLMEDGRGEWEAEDLGDAVAVAFNWKSSPEGYDFWSTIRRGEGFPPIPEA